MTKNGPNNQRIVGNCKYLLICCGVHVFFMMFLICCHHKGLFLLLLLLQRHAVIIHSTMRQCICHVFFFFFNQTVCERRFELNVDVNVKQCAHGFCLSISVLLKEMSMWTSVRVLDPKIQYFSSIISKFFPSCFCIVAEMLCLRLSVYV